MYTCNYRCWKCKKHWPVSQEENDIELELHCPKCDRKLFMVFDAPNISTDSTFMAGSELGLGSIQSEYARKHAQKLAKQAGVSTDGKRYCPQLAKHHGDPEAWVDGKSDVTRICRERGLGCEEFGVPLPADDSPHPHEGPYEVADHLVDKEMRRIEIQRGGDLTATERKNLRTDTKQRLKGEVEV
jgi:DNA-directed RNA polymerase subunit RPC12/RpoP